MPNEQQLLFPLANVVDLLDPPQIRTPGHHVTNLIYAADALSKGKPIRDDGPIVDDTGMMALGRLWEASVREWVQGYVDSLDLHVAHSIPVVIDGIAGNLDGLVGDVHGNYLAVIETKLTTSSKNITPSNNWNWMCQVKAYCHMVGVDQAWFPLLYIPHQGKPEARFSLWIETFTQQEIEENWRMLVNTKNYLEGLKV